LTRRAFRDDQKTAGEPVRPPDLTAGRTLNGTSETSGAGERQRTAGHVALQWLDPYAEAP
jgi:hypothetical protein